MNQAKLFNLDLEFNDVSCHILWNNLTRSADACSMQLLATVGSELQAADTVRAGVGEDGVAKYWTDRSVKFLSNVTYEACPMLWFQVSLFSLQFDNLSSEALAFMLGSVVSSVYVILGALPEELNGFHFLYMKWRSSGEVFLRNEVLRHGPAIALAILLLICSLIRLVFVWICPSHVFNFSSMGCVA